MLRTFPKMLLAWAKSQVLQDAKSSSLSFWFLLLLQLSHIRPLPKMVCSKFDNYKPKRKKHVWKECYTKAVASPANTYFLKWRTIQLS